MDSPNDLSSGQRRLGEMLHVRRTAALIADAEFIRNAPVSAQRDDEARRSIREAMLLFALRRITSAERDHILDILSFVTVHQPPPPRDRTPHHYSDDPDAHEPLA